jgi:N-acetylglutamate synthase-like GNAT family acetyltransferase
MDCSHVRFQYSETFSEADLDQLQRLFQAAAFWAENRDMRDMAVAIANSHPVVTVWDQDQLIGFARATSDGVYRATIWDVVIDPAYQGGGLGRKLVQTVLGHPHVSRVERVYLMTTHQQGFYERIGFQTNASTTLVLFNQPVDQDLTPVWQGAEATAN